MENKQESVTDTRVRLYRKALSPLREENEAKEREAQLTEEAEATRKEQDETGRQRPHDCGRE